jgi:AcrR family transcriptional regulator
LVEASGTRGLSWREIARKARVSHNAPYRHFANKEELLAAVAEQGFRSLTRRMIDEMAGVPDDVARQLEAMAVAYVEFATENPAHFRVMFGRDVPDIDKHSALREAHDVAVGLFRSGVTEVVGEVGPIGSQIDVDTFALMAWSLVHGLASLTVDARVGDIRESAGRPSDHILSMTALVGTLIEAMRPGEFEPNQSAPTGESRT